MEREGKGERGREGDEGESEKVQENGEGGGEGDRGRVRMEGEGGRERESEMGEKVKKLKKREKE